MENLDSIFFIGAVCNCTIPPGAGLELQGIDASILMQMDDEIKGVGNILIFISNFLFQFYVHNWF